MRERNLTLRPIRRQSNEILFPKTCHPPREKPPYPWENKTIGPHLRITKEFFRCRGSVLNPPVQVHQQEHSIYHLDCDGIEAHTLPIRNGKEYIYPILIDLLNHVQQETGKKVVITCGHQCPDHNLYADPSKNSRTSKHLIGAEVDFYVEGLEYCPELVIETLLAYYQEPFNCSKVCGALNAFAWHNKEVTITLYPATEKRDFDNRHPYPYVSIQVCYDKENGHFVEYNWHKAHTGLIKMHL